MEISSEERLLSGIKFFGLLLDQFRGTEGEVAMATAYLAQAVTEESPDRRATLLRIAREKLNNAEMLGAILLQIAKGESGPLPGRVNRCDLEELFKEKGLKTNKFDIAERDLDRSAAVDAYSGGQRRFNNEVRLYLAENIRIEVIQIAVYVELVGLAQSPTHISALNYAKEKQMLHRDEFVSLLRDIS